MTCCAQRNNVWLLHSNPKVNQYRDSSYCLDFNYCPPKAHYIYLENDKQLRYLHTSYLGLYYLAFRNSFCDTLGQFAFTELLGQHYYNKNGQLYDSSYIQNKYDKFGGSNSGAFLTVNDRTYYFKTFNQIHYDSNSVPRREIGWIYSDSILICESEFDNVGNLLKKNVPIYKFYSTNSHSGGTIIKFNARKLNNDTAELILNYESKGSNIVLNYNFKTGTVTKKKSLPLDTIYNMRYSTNTQILAASKLLNGITFLERNGTSHKILSSLDFNRYLAPQVKYKFEYIWDYCFSPNDSIIYVSSHYLKDTTARYKPSEAFLIAINYYNPYTDYKVIWLPNYNGGYHTSYFLKLGPDGNIYVNGGGRLKSNYRIIRPNTIKGFKLELLPDIKDGVGPYRNYSVDISTLDDYKKTEFIWQPTCNNLKVKFTNTCDTQHFKRYRLFFDNGDSLDLNKNWNSLLYNYKKEGKYYVRLKAFSKGGGFIWYGDSIEIHAPPIAKFGIQNTQGCQWAGYNFTDSSKYFGIKPGFAPYKRWFFGNGKDSIDAGFNPKLSYVYTQSGTVTVKLIVNNGYCSDTVEKINKVVILPAPKPGITASPINGCTPLKVSFKYKYSDKLDSAVWKSGEVLPSKFKGLVGDYTYTQSGNFWLTQYLYGASGCITRDSLRIIVSPGITGMPDILTATVTDSKTIDLAWKPHLNAVGYSILKNNVFLAKTTDTKYSDTKANTLIPNSYTIKAISMCNDSTTIQDLVKTIFLNGERTDQSEAKLSWTAFERWEFGVSNYKLYAMGSDGGFDLLAVIDGQTLSFTDKTFAGISEAQKCYKIVSEENQGNLQQSGSNVMCVPLKPTLLIPSAFSPNSDGINDTWFIHYQGITEVHLRIFNRWGELIYNYTSEKPEWDAVYKGLVVPNGTYFYQMEATGIKGEKVNKSGLVEVLR